MVGGWKIPAIVAGAAIVGLAGMSSLAGAEAAAGEAFLCHGVRAVRAPRGMPPLPSFHARVALAVLDRFSQPPMDVPHTVDLRRTALLCRPVAIEGAASSVGSYDFTMYAARPTRRRPMPPAPPPAIEEVPSPFGTVRLRTAKVATLAVPTIAADAGLPIGLPPDHFVCYDTRPLAAFAEARAARSVVVNGADGAQLLEIRKPQRLCVPASVRGGDPTAPKHAVDLVCFDVRVGRDAETRRPAPRDTELLATHNPFGSEVLKLGAGRQLCVGVAR